MRKHHLSYLAACAIALGGLAAASAAQAQADAEKSRPVLSLYHVEVKHGESRAWREGVKALKDCYGEQKGERSWWTWERQNGRGTLYTVVLSSPSWADFDNQDPNMRACYTIFDEKMSPHEVSVTTQFMRPNSDLHQPGTGPVARVTGLTLNDYDKFMEVAKAVTETQKAEKAAPREWFDNMAGANGEEDVLVIRRYDNYAGMDAEEEGLWAMMTRVNGEEKSKAWRAQAREAIDAGWTYIYEYKADLSYEPTKK